MDASLFFIKSGVKTSIVVFGEVCLIDLIVFVNLSYASFPISNALTINQDTIKKEPINNAGS